MCEIMILCRFCQIDAMRRLCEGGKVEILCHFCQIEAMRRVRESGWVLSPWVGLGLTRWLAGWLGWLRSTTFFLFVREFMIPDLHQNETKTPPNRLQNDSKTSSRRAPGVLQIPNS